MAVLLGFLLPVSLLIWAKMLRLLSRAARGFPLATQSWPRPKKARARLNDDPELMEEVKKAIEAKS